MEDDLIHLATGIICGGDKLWCGAKMETEYREDTGKLHVLNATQTPERVTCPECKKRHDAALKKAGVKPFDDMDELLAAVDWDKVREEMKKDG